MLIESCVRSRFLFKEAGLDFGDLEVNFPEVFLRLSLDFPRQRSRCGVSCVCPMGSMALVAINAAAAAPRGSTEPHFFRFSTSNPVFLHF